MILIAKAEFAFRMEERMAIFHVDYQGKKLCATCQYWQEWEDRVYARLSFKGRAPHGRRSHELRRCRYSPNPQVDLTEPWVYTDESFVCDTWAPAAGWKDPAQKDKAEAG
jgi:hypothetical protein